VLETMVRTGNLVPGPGFAIQGEALDHGNTGRCGDTTGRKE
jgi:hypothetical protein